MLTGEQAEGAGLRPVHDVQRLPASQRSLLRLVLARNKVSGRHLTSTLSLSSVYDCTCTTLDLFACAFSLLAGFLPCAYVRTFTCSHARRNMFLTNMLRSAQDDVMIVGYITSGCYGLFAALSCHVVTTFTDVELELVFALSG